MTSEEKLKWCDEVGYYTDPDNGRTIFHDDYDYIIGKVFGNSSDIDNTIESYYEQCLEHYNKNIRKFNLNKII